MSGTCIINSYRSTKGRYDMFSDEELKDLQLAVRLSLGERLPMGDENRLRALEPKLERLINPDTYGSSEYKYGKRFWDRYCSINSDRHLLPPRYWIWWYEWHAEYINMIGELFEDAKIGETIEETRVPLHHIEAMIRRLLNETVELLRWYFEFLYQWAIDDDTPEDQYKFIILWMHEIGCRYGTIIQTYMDREFSDAMRIAIGHGKERGIFPEDGRTWDYTV